MKALRLFYPQGVLPIYQKAFQKIDDLLYESSAKVISTCILYPESDICQPTNFDDGSLMNPVLCFSCLIGKDEISSFWTGLRAIAMNQINGGGRNTGFVLDPSVPAAIREIMIEQVSSLIESLWEVYIWKLFAYCYKKAISNQSHAKKLFDCIWVILQNTDLSSRLKEAERECFLFQVLEVLVKVDCKTLGLKKLILQKISSFDLTPNHRYLAGKLEKQYESIKMPPSHQVSMIQLSNFLS